MHVYFIRHGETEFNRQNIVQGSGVDSELNETGRAQAGAFFEMYRNVPFELVVTSALQRTHQTVQQFIDSGITWHQTADINEISWGELEGTAPSPASRDAFIAILGAWRNGDLDASFPGGESARSLETRVERFVEWLRQRPEKHILVATHGRTLRALITRLKGLPVSEMDHVGHANTGCYLAEFTADGVVFHKENDLGHL